MDNQQCVCDQCGITFIIKSCSRIMKIGRDIKRHLLVCPGCKAEYTSYYTNAEIRKQQNKISKLYNAIRMTRNKSLLDQYYKKIDSIQADLERDMNQLRIEVEGTPQG
ncbi:transglycosylase [Bacillus altitudinis]|uniref:Transglycosylase n=1 Tax=Bacillus altitudinis TaxID=293387 RepID=A0ABV1S566_BACAB